MLKNCTRIAVAIFTFTQIAACGSTAESDVPLECSPQKPVVCDDPGQDRGFDPCLVNDKLPVCKAK
jgi:hypothetical protein